MLGIALIFCVIILISMLKFELSKRQKDRKLKKAVDEHMKEIRKYESSSGNYDGMDSEAVFSACEAGNSISDNNIVEFDNEDLGNLSDFDNPSFSSLSDSEDDVDIAVESQGANINNGTNENKSDLADELRACFVKHHVTREFVNDILMILRKHHDLPKDARTLLSTPVSVETKTLTNGEYVHFGIRHGLEELLQLGLLDGLENIRLSFNVDGLPLFKSSSKQVWAILGLVNNILPSKPFVIGIFCGNNKPGDVSEYLFDFIADVRELLHNPVIGDRKFSIFIDAFLCDAPARSFLKCVKSYNGYFGCERCMVKGKWLGRMTFTELDAPERKNEDFLHVIVSDSDEHIMGVSPLLNIGIDVVSMFPLDYMHLVCLGVVRKLLLRWYKARVPLCVFSSTARKNLNQNLLACAQLTPKEFQRKPRALSEIDRWKATEFRCFLLYTGPVVLKDILSTDLYNHFLCLHIAMRILLSDVLIIDYLDYAQELLCYFVMHCKTLYGEEFVVYNVHSLIHLPQDVRRFGSLNKVSAFPFESYLGKIKKLLRTPNKPLQQICKRLIESKGTGKHQTVENNHLLSPIISSSHFDGPTLNCQGVQYKEVKGLNFCLKIQSGDNCVLLRNVAIILVHNFIYDHNQLLFIGQEFLHKTSFYSKPCDSSKLKTYYVFGLSSLKCWSANEFLCKGILLPYKNSHVFMPLLHSYDNYF